jgi:hypothetical protein
MIAIGFVRNEFNIRDKGTWMAPFIRGVLNADNRKKGIENIRFNHVVLLVNDTVYEAGWDRFKKKACVLKRTLTDWLASRSDKGDYEFYEYKEYKYGHERIMQKCEKYIGTPYDFWSVLVWQLIRQITNKRVWLGPKGWIRKRLYCSNFVSFILDLDITPYLMDTDPEDLLNWVKESKFKEIKL